MLNDKRGFDYFAGMVCRSAGASIAVVGIPAARAA
jgi:hypothetical protein